MNDAQKDFREIVKVLSGAFVIAAILYAISFWWIQHKREDKGAWKIAFSADAAGKPTISISQPTLHIEKVELTFPEQTVTNAAGSEVVLFDKPTTNAPFGEVVFQDPTFLPGTIMFNFWGHGVELLPRVLVIDQQEIAWQPRTNITISGPGKFERHPVKKPLIL